MHSTLRPLIVVFSALGLATLLSYAAVELTEPSKRLADNSTKKLTCEYIDAISIPPKGAVIPNDRVPLSPEESKLLFQKTLFQETLVKAQSGDLDAMIEIAGAYLVGLGTPIDRPAALKWVHLAATKGHVQSQFSYGKICLLGELRPKDIAEAIRWFRLAAEKQNPDAELSLAQAYVKGEGVEADQKEAVRWLKLSATHGHPVAQSDYAFAILDDNNPAICGESAEWLRKSALQGNASAMFNLAIMYQRGIGVPKERITAYAWYMVSEIDGNEHILEEVKKVLAQATPGDRRKAIEAAKGIIAKLKISPMLSAGSHSIELTNQFHRQLELALVGAATDQYDLARLYHEGVGTVKDPFEAAVWCRRAAEQGNVEAMCSLALCLASGDGVDADLTEMAKWYRKAADKGNIESQHQLGVCYMEGKGVVKDEGLAEVWTKKSADQGHAISQANMGAAILLNKDQRRLPEAANWFKLSAKQGFPHGMYKYGVSLFLGAGVTKNRVEGAAWTIACLSEADEDLKEAVKKLLEELTPDERKQAEAAAIEIEKTL